jgi:hypothetical protein
LSGDEGHEYYMKKLEEEKTRQLWEYFYEGKVDFVLAEPWIESNENEPTLFANLAPGLTLFANKKYRLFQ